MIDIHTHLLPACDDGSPDLETTLSYLDKISQEGVRDLFFTPHYFLNIYDFELAKIKKNFQRTKKETLNRKIPLTLHLGAEIYLDDQTYEDIDFKNLTLGKTSYLLIETNMKKLSDNFYLLIYKLVKNGYKPILAHPERYAFIKSNIGLAEDFIHKNIYIQVNAGSLLGAYGKSATKAAWQLLEKGFVHFLASDEHTGGEDYFLSKIKKLVETKFDDYTFELLTKINPRRLLLDQDIEYFYLKEDPQATKNMLRRIFELLFKG